MTAWFYMLRLRSGKLYSGATSDLARRCREHEEGVVCRTTRFDRPVELACAEEHESFAVARRREAQRKRWSAGKKQALVAGDLVRLRALAVSGSGRG